MAQRQIGMAAIALGVVAIVLALLGDTLGVGAQENTFGWKQIVLLVVGVAITFGGAVALARGSSSAR